MRKKSRLFALAEALRARRTGVTAAAARRAVRRHAADDLSRSRGAAGRRHADPRRSRRGGGYALDKNYQLPPVNFTAREAALLVALARIAIEQRLMPFPDAIETRGRQGPRRALDLGAARAAHAGRRAPARRRACAAGPADRARRDRDRVVRVARAAHRLREEGVAAEPAPRADPQPRVRSLRSRCSTASISRPNQDRQFRLDQIKQATVLDRVALHARTA